MAGGDEVFLEGLRFYAYHGVNPEERVQGQRFVVDVRIAANLREAGRTDDLTKTVNYSLVYQRVREIVEGEPRNLIETVAESIAVMILRDREHDLRLRQTRLNHYERAGGGEGKGHRPRDLAREHGAVGEIDDGAMELLVQLDVAGEAVDRQSALEDERVEAGQAVLKVVEVGSRYAAFGREPGGQALERAADLDRRMDVALVEGADDEAAGGKRLQQAFLLQTDQRRADRRSGDAEPFDQKELRHPLAGLDLAAEDELAQLQQRVHGLRR